MVGESKPESVRQRYSLYIDELREFFASRNVSWGHLDDLPALAAQLALPGPLTEEVGSLVRSMVYQEEERLGRGELLQILTTAVAGAEVQADTESLQAAVRNVFLFLNAELQPTQTRFNDSSEAADASEPEDLVLQPISEEPFEPDPISSALNHPPQASLPPGATRQDVLYRAMSLSAEQDREPPAMSATATPTIPSPAAEARPWWAIPATGVALAAILAGAYVGAPLLRHDRPRPDSPVAAPRLQSLGAESQACAAPLAAGATRSGLEERSLWAHNLLSQGLYDAALPELREIARLDPGYPGIELDESDALLHLKRPEEARDAVDAQISIAQCLERLPAAALDEYCRAQYALAAVGGCQQQLTHIRQAAELQAALVHLELGHSVQPDASAAAALAELNQEEQASAKVVHPAAKVPVKPVAKSVGKVREAEPLPPATEGDTAQPPLSRKDAAHTGKGREAGNGSLVHGEGTDSVYGAYQKPQ